MIKKLKIKFIVLSMVSLFVLLVFIIAGMNFVNYISFVDETDELLTLLSHSRWDIPGLEGGDKSDRFPHHISPEAPYEARYFTVTADSEGNLIKADVSKIVTVSADTALRYAAYAMSKDSDSGFTGSFRYLKITDETGTRLIFLDCGRKIDALESFALSSISMAALGYIVISLAVIILAEMIIRPVRESYRKQKQFITDAGHEIKTPLTVINANADLFEMEYGDNEYLCEIKSQTKRLGELTESLVYLSKMEEEQHSLAMIDFPISEVIAETASSFNALAQVNSKQLLCDIEPMLSANGNAPSIRQLASILLDNAMKYSPSESDIHLELKKQGRYICLSIHNVSIAPIDKKSLSKIFDRFYRTDPSRNSQTGGNGIGLSIAKAIADAHNGKIQATTHDGASLTVTVTIPC